MEYTIDSLLSSNFEIELENVSHMDLESATVATHAARSEKLNIAAIFLLVIPIATILGNLLVIISVWREKTLRTATNYFIVSMASADVLVALLVMPFAVYVEVENGLWHLPRTLCNVYIALDVCASTASILNLVAISWDRYMAVSKPISYSRTRKNTKRVLITIFLIWACSLIIASPIVMGSNRLDNTPHCEFTNAIFIIVSSFASFFLPCFVMVALYSVVLQKLRKRQLQIRANKLNNTYLRMAETRPSRRKSRQSWRATADTTTSFGAGDWSVARASTFNADLTPNNAAIINHLSIGNKGRYIFSYAPGINLLNAAISTISPSTLLFFAPSSSSNTGNGQCSQIINAESNRVDEISSDLVSTSDDNSDVRNGPDTPHLLQSLDNRGYSASRGGLTESTLDSMPFIDTTAMEIDNHSTEISKNIRRSSAPAACNGAPKKFSYSNHCISKTDLHMSDMCHNGMPEFIIHSATVTGSGLCVNEFSSLMPTLHANGNISTLSPFRSCGGENIAEMIRKRSSSSIGAIATRFRDLAFASKERRARMTRRRAVVSKYSRQCRKERKATYMLAVVLVVFLACWLPFFTCHITSSICIIRTGETCVDIVAFFMTTWLGYMNSLMNPVIYTVFNPDFRRAFKAVLVWCFHNRGRVANRRKNVRL